MRLNSREVVAGFDVEVTYCANVKGRGLKIVDGRHPRCNTLFAYLEDVFLDDLDVTVVQSPIGCVAWIVIECHSTEERCYEVKKRLRRLQRGKPRFQITAQTLVHEVC